MYHLSSAWAVVSCSRLIFMHDWVAPKKFFCAWCGKAMFEIWWRLVHNNIIVIFTDIGQADTWLCLLSSAVHLCWTDKCQYWRRYRCVCIAGRGAMRPGVSVARRPDVGYRSGDREPPVRVFDRRRTPPRKPRSPVRRRSRSPLRKSRSESKSRSRSRSPPQRPRYNRAVRYSVQVPKLSMDLWVCYTKPCVSFTFSAKEDWDKWNCL